MSRKFFYLFMVLLFFSCNRKTGKQSIVIDIWYGEQQEFGKLGLPQKWINVLGNVQSKNGIKSFIYNLNASDPKTLTLGSDLHRLAAKGDFNVDLDIEECVEGVNELVITALDSAGHSMVEKISISM